MKQSTNGGSIDQGLGDNELKATSPHPLTPDLSPSRPVLITGGAGFVGTNVAHRLLSQGRKVIIYDNLSRPGVENNLRWLVDTYGDNVQPEISDVRDADSLRQVTSRASAVFHFAAQVAVTSSISDPVEDFTVNAQGTLNLLEALRALDNPPPLLFTSTNKVYGGLEDVPFRSTGSRYEPTDPFIRMYGINERRRLDFHSPYGCSKGAADQYVLDYARTFGLKAAVFRMSCIYGPHQFGTEDQGWVAHFLICAMNGEPITLYGDGMQVRDILFVEDLVDAFMLALENIDDVSGEAFNMGGGPDHTVSLLEILDMIGRLRGEKPDVRFSEWRPGDQRYYVSDTAKFRGATGWKPHVDVQKGVEQLYGWLREFRATGKSAAFASKNGWNTPAYPEAVGIGEASE